MDIRSVPASELQEQYRVLLEENDQLRRQQSGQQLKAEVEEKANLSEFKAVSKELGERALTVIVVGASGHLARTKTFPALSALFGQGLLPPHVNVVGFARSALTDAAFAEKISPKLKGGCVVADEAGAKEAAEHKRCFLERCTYFSGQYGNLDDFKRLDARLTELETKHSDGRGPKANRLFYYAIPPSVFADTSRSIKAAAMSKTGWTRVVVEKPFGKDTESSNDLSRVLLGQFKESQIFRIDHYLGKEMVQNLLVMRFANMIFSPIWHRQYISSVLITFKEKDGVVGRGGYFDSFGIIRDVMQNHLMQIVSLVAMEQPVSLSAEDIRDEKVKVLRAIAPLRMEDVVVGQYTGDAAQGVKGYTEDDSVPDDSVTPTFALAVMRIKNARWQGVPFILKCGKGLNERKAEIRIQLRQMPGMLFPEAAPNEIVIRVQPNESMYVKILGKTPGLSEAITQTELDLTYASRFGLKQSLPDAYERLVLDALRGDHRLFVRNDELEHAWKIFTPVLHEMESAEAKRDGFRPIPYKYGGRGPAEADERIAKEGVKRYAGYIWAGGKKDPQKKGKL